MNKPALTFTDFTARRIPAGIKLASQRVLPENVQIAAAMSLAEVDLPAEGEAVTWNMLFPAGDKITRRDGIVVRNPDPQAVVDAYNADDVEIMIDVNHDSVFFDCDPPAQGWVAAMELREGAIWGQIEWTDLGLNSLQKKHYRYLSPAYHDNPDGELVSIVSAGLVNQPAMSMPAVARADISKTDTPQTIIKESAVDEEQLARLRKAYGLADDASVDDVIAASIAAAPEQAADLDPEAVAAAAAAAAAEAEGTADENIPDISQYVPRADYDVIAAELDAVNVAASQAPAAADIEAAVDAAITARRVAPASRAHYIKMCSTQDGFDGFKAFAKTGPEVVSGKAAPTPLSGVQTAGSLSETELKVCRALGTSPDKLAASKLKAKGA